MPHTIRCRLVLRRHTEMERIRTRTPFMYCRAEILATNLLSAHPVAMPRIPPSGFVTTVNLALISALVTSTRTLARAKLRRYLCLRREASDARKYTRPVLGKPLWARTSDTAETPSGRPSIECLVGNRGLFVGRPWFPPVDVCSACGMSLNTWC